ncbi:MAG: murein L,D-transpeptidase [Bacteroidales bacterium]|nr:murein L,D-transpeptidase [Bacteroidales bacterium]
MCFITHLLIILNSIVLIQSNIPESDRSKAVIRRQYPLLENSFEAKELTFGNSVFIRILKEEYELEVWIKKINSYALFKTYKICSYSGGLGPKKREGDGKSPEGFYTVGPRQLNPNSNFHLSFNLGYPNAYDRAHSYTGSALMVHGNCVSIGCYAMTDDYIEEIYAIAQKTFESGHSSFKIHIFPFRMTEENMEKHRDSEYYNFWLNLKDGYDFFQNNMSPPDVSVRNMKYVFM